MSFFSEHEIPEPIFYPCQVRHTRVHPVVHSFSYPYLWVVLPVRWRGNSIEKYNSPVVSGWFTVDPGDYLERGNHAGLHGKLRQYLHSQHLQDEDYPYVLLLTAPKVLGHVFNPVSFWYLYSAKRELAAVILEVNNNFGERHMYLLSTGSSEGTSVADPADQPSTTKRFASTWPKTFHVSPFNPREGMAYTLTTADPLRCEKPIDSRIVLVASQRVHLIASIRATGPAIRPAALSAYQRSQLIISWGWVGALTEPRIYFQAAKLHVQRRLRVWSLPVPLETTISRRANRLERSLEPFVRGYLRHRVENAHGSFTVRYSAAGLLANAVEFMQSPLAGITSNKCPDKAVEFRVLRPDFYTSFVESPALTAEVFQLLAGNDFLRVSRMDLLRDLFNESDSVPELCKLSGPGNLALRILAWFRKGRPAASAGCSLSALDCYVLSSCSAAEQRDYWLQVLKLFLSRYVAFGHVPLFEAELVVLLVILLVLGVSWSLSLFA
ncbi:hypothetical protein AbraIFM66951_009698 [Aspergillus brasiliensis]|uniref:DUF1365 domain-containing protein n=1 Tax=Aspergillus brasiliensis TaxID=319629 RepID=A0A9W5YUU0_9EURO|nr:hypothetical protein AbraCBS73388_009784 [Aspergillus brasiliensis]GKZ46569.1 hypothetical protein AbraIFM66951_009698 [Aspergillus brasiliensis]